MITYSLKSEPSVYELVNENHKGIKSCNKVVFAQCVLCIIYYTHGALCSTIIKIY